MFIRSLGIFCFDVNQCGYHTASDREDVIINSVTTVLYRELAFQIYKEYERFSKYFDNTKTSVFFGGISIKKDEEVMKSNCPHIVVGTPGRILALCRDKTLNLKHIKHFILDECDKMLEQLGESQPFQ